LRRGAIGRTIAAVGRLGGRSRGLRLAGLVVVVSLAVGVMLLRSPAARATCGEPSVTLSADHTDLDANAPTAQLTATLSGQMCDPRDMLSIYDDSGNRLAVLYSGMGLTLGVSVTPGNNQTRTYTAYESQDIPNPGPPSSIISTSNSLTLQNHGWDGTVTLTASTTQTDANAPTATLTPSLSKPLAGYYYLSIYDDQGNRIADWSAGQNITAVSVTPGNNQTRTYTAEVSLDIPSPGPPTVDVRSPQSVTIQNVGWDGTVTLTSSTTQTDANAPTATLTPSLSKPLAGAYYLSIYDDLGNRIADWSAGQQPSAVSVTPGNDQARTYTAEVSLDIPSPGPPSVDVRSPQSVTLSDQGWTGGLDLDGPTTVTPLNPNALLTMTLSKPLAGPYILSLYDDQGNRIADWYPGQQATSVYVTPNPSATVTYTAYISLDVPSPGPPMVDVRDTASVTYTNGTISGESMQDVDLDYLTGLFASESDEQVAEDMCETPEATHFEELTVCDEGTDYLAARGAGDDRKQAIKRAMKYLAAATGGFIGSLILSHTDPPSPPQAVPQTPPPPPPAPTDPSPPEVISGPTLTYEDWLAELYQQRAAVAGYGLTPAAAQTGARECVEQTTWAIESGAESPSGEPCAELPIFFPGRNSLSVSGTAPTTQHDWDAITGSGGVDHSSPSWIQLNYVSQNDRIDSGLSRKPAWYRNDPICQAKQDGQDCDEYPFFSSAQSGPASFAGPPGASLRALSSSDNRSQGSRYYWFAKRCALASGGADKDTAAEDGSPFLVIPIPSAAAPLTFGVCGGS
jgi:hypothetical protein